MPFIIFGNVRSLINKIDDLRLTIASVHQYKLAHILTITESWGTWGTEEIADDFLEIEGFTMIRHDRRAESGKKKEVAL